MVTDEDRRLALDNSKKRNEHHRLNGCYTPQMAMRLEHDETVRRGLLGEAAFANEFGLKVDYSIRDGNDGGKDFSLVLRTRSGIETFKVDVKTKSVRTDYTPFIADDIWLRVPVKQTVPRTIYVAAIYLERFDDARIIKWEWGSGLIAHNDVRVMDGDVRSYIKPYKLCRDLAELKDRVIVPTKGVEEYFCETCGALASFGFGVSLLRGVRGHWYCREHKTNHQIMKEQANEDSARGSAGSNSENSREASRVDSGREEADRFADADRRGKDADRGGHHGTRAVEEQASFDYGPSPISD